MSKNRGRPRTVHKFVKGSKDEKDHNIKLEKKRKLRSYVFNSPLIKKTNEILKALNINKKYNGDVYLAKQKIKVALFEFIMESMKKKDESESDKKKQIN